MKDFKWEQIDDCHQRLKIHGGWLVKAFAEVYISLHEDEPPQPGYEWRISICFVPDPTHVWSLEKEFTSVSTGIYEGTMKCNECSFTYIEGTEVTSGQNKERSKHSCEDYK